MKVEVLHCRSGVLKWELKSVRYVLALFGGVIEASHYDPREDIGVLLRASLTARPSAGPK